jgi:hypothetical protein
MQDISGVGLVVIIRASTTFATVPLNISQFADDADPLDIPALQIADSAMGLNGDLLKWAKANPISLTLNVIPAGADDTNLQILGDANRVGQGKVSARDEITATVVYPDGRIVILNKGYLKNYMPGNSVSSSQRIKTKPYVFEFESKT